MIEKKQRSQIVKKYTPRGNLLLIDKLDKSIKGENYLQKVSCFARFEAGRLLCPVCKTRLVNRKIIIEYDESQNAVAEGEYCKNCDVMYTKAYSEIKDMFDGISNIQDEYLPYMPDNATPRITTDSILYVYDGIRPCWHAGIISYKAIIGELDSKKGFYVEYCRSCRRFYMRMSDYESYLRRLKFIPMKVELLSNCKSFYFEEFELREKSPLMIHGYTVKESVGYSNEIRQEILKSIIDYGWLEKSTVLNYLTSFIERGENNPRMYSAVSKWRKDKEFVLEYNLEKHRKVEIGELIYKGLAKFQTIYK